MKRTIKMMLRKEQEARIMCDKGYKLPYCANIATPYDVDGKICEIFHKCIQMWKGFYSLRRIS